MGKIIQRARERQFQAAQRRAYEEWLDDMIAEHERQRLRFEKRMADIRATVAIVPKAPSPSPRPWWRFWG